jgi:head-tail adaptor
MNPGLMRTPLLIQTRAVVVTTYGQPTFTYSGSTYIFGQITECNAEEKLNHHKMNQVVTHKITSNFYPGLKAGDRFTASASRGTDGNSISATYEIISVVDYRQEGHTLNLICREIQNV